MKSVPHRIRGTLGRAFPSFSAETAAFAILLALVLVAPLPYGGVLPGGSLAIEALAFAAAALAALSGRFPRLGPAALPFAALGGIALLGVVQLVPLPGALLSTVSPGSARVYAEADQILALFSHPPRFSPRISIAPEETFSTVLLGLAYLASFVAASSLLGSRDRRRVFIATVFAAALGQIAWAVSTQPREGRLAGSFVNPDHLAGYLEIALALAFGGIVVALHYGKRSAYRAVEAADRLERRLLPVSMAVLLWGAIAAGVALTQSRGGILAGALTALVLLGLFWARRRLARRRTAPVAETVGILAGIGFVALALGKLPLLRFMATDPHDLRSDTRLQVWGLALDAWKDFPLLGSGLGCFRDAFRRVQPRDLPGLVEQAHSDPLQLLVTAGAVGALLGAVALAAGFFLLLREAPRQEHREEAVWALTGFGALLSLTLHGLVDFNLSIPAVPVTLAAVLGAAWRGATWREGDDRVTG